MIISMNEHNEDEPPPQQDTCYTAINGIFGSGRQSQSVCLLVRVERIMRMRTVTSG